MRLEAIMTRRGLTLLALAAALLLVVRALITLLFPVPTAGVMGFWLFWACGTGGELTGLYPEEEMMASKLEIYGDGQHELDLIVFPSSHRFLLPTRVLASYQTHFQPRDYLSAEQRAEVDAFATTRMMDYLDERYRASATPYPLVIESATRKYRWWPGLVGNAAAVLGVVLAVVAAVLGAWRLGTGQLRRERLREGLCENCGYDLRGEHRRGCPECGWGRENA
jgi:hypothetical protein